MDGPGQGVNGLAQESMVQETRGILGHRISTDGRGQGSMAHSRMHAAFLSGTQAQATGRKAKKKNARAGPQASLPVADRVTPRP